MLADNHFLHGQGVLARGRQLSQQRVSTEDRFLPSDCVQQLCNQLLYILYVLAFQTANIFQHIRHLHWLYTTLTITRYSNYGIGPSKWLDPTRSRFNMLQRVSTTTWPILPALRWDVRQFVHWLSINNSTVPLNWTLANSGASYSPNQRQG